jgi:hypothetical protein
MDQFRLERQRQNDSSPWEDLTKEVSEHIVNMFDFTLLDKALAQRSACLYFQAHGERPHD